VKNNTDTLPDSVIMVEYNGGDSESFSIPSTIFGDSVPGLGYTTDTLVIDSATAATAGSYKCIVRNSHGIAVSESITLNVIDLPLATRVLYERGETRYRDYCVSCHGTNGKGDGITTPPHNPADYVMASTSRFVRLQFLGLPNFMDTTGIIDVNGKTYNSLMMSMGGNDSDIAGVLTYIRDRFNGATDSVAPELVGIIRDSLVAQCARYVSQNGDQSFSCYVDSAHNN
jgi:mono/diheme cytochrome c family protein